MELQRDYHQLQAAGIDLVTISYDSQEVLKRFADAFDVGFTMLADEGSAVIKRFDLLNPVPEWGMEEGIDDDPALKKQEKKEPCLQILPTTGIDEKPCNQERVLR